MGWNNGLEQKRFQKRLNEEVECLLKNGCTESEIQSWIEMSKRDFCSDRRYAMHTQPLEVSFEGEEYTEEKNPLYRKFIYELTVRDDCADDGLFGWLDSMENEAILSWTRTLGYKDKLLLTLHVQEQMTLKEAAKQSGVSYATAKRRFSKWKSELSKLYASA